MYALNQVMLTIMPLSVYFWLLFLFCYSQGSIDVKYNQTFKQPEIDLANGTVIEVSNATVIDSFEKGIKELEEESPTNSEFIQDLVQTFNITHARMELRGYSIVV